MKTETRKMLREIYQPPPAEDYSKNYTRLIIVILISVVFIAAEMAGGFLSGSISIISDAFHLVTDMLGFVLAFVFLRLSQKKDTEEFSFGYHRMELIGAIANIFVIWVLAAFMLEEATMRLINKQFVQSPKIMLIVGCGGLVVNIIMYFVLHGSGEHSHGLMNDSCGHSHEHNKQETHKTSDSCMDFCDDEVCLQAVSFNHCHKGQAKEIHKHQSKPAKKDSDKENSHEGHNCDGKHEHKPKKPAQIKQSKQHEHGSNCKHVHPEGHQHKRGHDHGHEHKHDHGHEHKHDHGHEHKHDHDNEHKHGDDHVVESLSMRAAVLHAITDVIQSVGILIAALFIFFLGSDMGATVTEWNNWHYLDPITTYVFSIFVIASTLPIVKSCYLIIMEATPARIDLGVLKKEFEEVKGVVDVHDIHVWDLRHGKTIMIAHLLVEKDSERSVLAELTDLARQKRVYHSTFQIQQQVQESEEYILCRHDIH